jgi:hypothetical protein
MAVLVLVLVLVVVVPLSCLTRQTR